ncbi:Microtubule-associated protein 9 [Cricetulus griseus]|uniref:Microtubule-associated protein 9 n=1 Tax=Cricetulus griseus TaxID=10029 RepID=G3H5I2_CRIGR|nr:Microtubule-associated protein 9 [Cricetulus griseus]ERE90480.1 microtubule-associated protein 9 [Cricetulus griseus]
MSDEIFSTTLAYTKSPKATKRTSFQDELIRAITARSARQRSSEYSDDFDSDEIGEFSDTSTDESLVRKKVNDFHISDDEEKSSPRLSFLKTKKVNSDVAKDGQESVTQISEDMSPDVHDDPKSQNDDQEVGKEITEIKAKPRVLPIKKSTSSDHDGEPTEIWDSLISNENEENSVLVNCVTPEVELPKTSQVTADDTEEEKEKAGFTDDDFTTDPLLSTSPSVITPTETAEPAKKSGPTRRSPSAATSSHYLGTLKVLDKKPSRKQSIETDKADHIRAAVYQEWLEKKNVYLHEMHRIKRIESENLRIQNEQKRAAKREEALASFEAWKAMKEKEAKKIAAKKRLEEKNKRKTEEENAVRKSEALQAFEKWKEKKLEYLKEKTRKEKEYERAKKQKEEETVAEKKKDNLTAFEKWSEKKEALLKQKEKEKINERRKEELKRAEKKDKDQQAISEYEKWLEKKERQERVDRKQKKRHSYLESETHPPWSPPSRTVPSKVL